MGSKFLDYTGLSYYSSLLKNYFMKKGDTADAASKLETARNISLTGDATGSASFDGSEDTSISTTLASSGVTAGSYGPSEDASPEHSGTFSVPYVTVDAKGRVTAASTKTITLPSDNNTDTKVTNTLATTTKAYLTGTTSDTTNTGTQVFDTGVYLGTSAGELNARTLKLTGNAGITASSGDVGYFISRTDVGTKVSLQIGSAGAYHGLYSSSDGRWIVFSDGTNIHVGASTVGSGTKPIYLSSGVPTASSSTVGSGTKPVYLSSGTITASGSTVGSSATPVYLNAGTLTACSNVYTSSDWTVMEVGSGVLMSYNASMTSGTTITFPFTLSGTIRAFATRVGTSPDAYYSVTTTTTTATVYHSSSGSLGTNLFVFSTKA